MEDGGAARERRKGIARRNEEESQRKDDGPAASHRPPHQRPRLLCIPIGTPKATARVGQHLPPARALAHRIRPVCPPTRMRLTRARTPATPHPERTLAHPHFSAPEVTFLLHRTRARRPHERGPAPPRRSLARLISQKGNQPLTSSRNARGL
ncbi:hypothetical protein B0H14DRAFT_2956342 [Mycena olivaceomarginata]|nr:hypothetical protein B0H14DRAFT_2956342 [Mycena olivaceomarginata]